MIRIHCLSPYPTQKVYMKAATERLFRKYLLLGNISPRKRATFLKGYLKHWQAEIFQKADPARSYDVFFDKT